MTCKPFSKTVCSVSATILSLVTSGCFLGYALFFSKKLFLIPCGAFFYFFLVTMVISIFVQCKTPKKRDNKPKSEPKPVFKIGSIYTIKKSCEFICQDEHNKNKVDFGKIKNLEINNNTLKMITSANNELDDAFSYGCKIFWMSMYKKDNRIFDAKDVAEMETFPCESDYKKKFEKIYDKLNGRKQYLFTFLAEMFKRKNIKEMDKTFRIFISDCIFGKKC